MITTIIALLLVGAVAYRLVAPDTRERVLRTVVLIARALVRYGHDELEPFRHALRARTRFAIVTLSIAAIDIVVFARMTAAGGPGGAATLIAWGASVGPRTTNGEWWRIFTALFVHAGVLPLIVGTIALLQIGVLLERLVGPALVSATYFAAGILAGLLDMSTHQTAVIAGSAGPVLGLYGLLLTIVVVGRWRPSPFSVPTVALVRLAPAAIVFLLDSLVETIGVGAATAALATGVFFGVSVARDLRFARAPVRRTVLAAGVALALAVLMAVPLRGIVDAGAELDRVVAVEHSTAARYEMASTALRKGTTTAEAVTQVIERGIVPELRAADARMAALDRVPREDVARIADGRRFLQLRMESWRLRAQSLRVGAKPAVLSAAQAGDAAPRVRAEAQYRSTLLARGKAEAAERAAIEALNRIARQDRS